MQINVRLFTGQSGRIIINENADRLTNYDVYTFGPGNDSYYRYMTIDVSKPMSEASDIHVEYFPFCKKVASTLKVGGVLPSPGSYAKCETTLHLTAVVRFLKKSD